MSARKLWPIPLVLLAALAVWIPLRRAGESPVPTSDPAPTSPAEAAPPRSPEVRAPEAAVADRQLATEGNVADGADATLVVSVARAEAPVVGARVWLPGPQEEAAAATTDAQGKLELAVPPGIELTLAVTEGARPIGAGGAGEADPPFLFQVDALAPGERAERKLELYAPFWGRLVAADNGLPIADALILSDDPSVGELRSAVDGRFRLPTRAHGKRLARVEAQGFAPARIAPVSGYGDSARPLEVRLERAASLEPLLLGPNDEPVAGAEVKLVVTGDALLATPGALMASGRWQRAAVSGPDGRFHVEGLPPGVPIEIEVRSSVGSELTPPGPLVLQPGERAQPVWRLGGTAVVRGILLDASDAPVPGHGVWLCRPVDELAMGYLTEGHEQLAQTQTGADGRFELRDVPAGGWWLGPAPAPAPAAVCPAAVAVQVGPGEQLEVVLRTWRGLAIEGRVVSSDGQPLSAGRVYCTPVDGSGHVLADVRDGHFSVGPLAPGMHRLKAFAGVGVSKYVEARAGEDGVELRLDEIGAVIVDVSDENRAFSSRFAVEFFQRDAPGRAQLESHVTHWGAVTNLKVGLPIGVYDVVAKMDGGHIGYHAGAVVESGGELALDIAVQRGAKLQLRYEGGPERAEYRIYQGASQVAFGRLVRSAAEIEVVPAGAVRVELVANQQTLAEREVYLTVDRLDEVVLALD